MSKKWLLVTLHYNCWPFLQY